MDEIYSMCNIVSGFLNLQCVYEFHPYGYMNAFYSIIDASLLLVNVSVVPFLPTLNKVAINFTPAYQGIFDK